MRASCAAATSPLRSRSPLYVHVGYDICACRYMHGCEYMFWMCYNSGVCVCVCICEYPSIQVLVHTFLCIGEYVYVCGTCGYMCT